MTVINVEGDRGGRPEEKGVGGVREAGEGGIPKVAGSERNREKLSNRRGGNRD